MVIKLSLEEFTLLCNKFNFTFKLKLCEELLLEV